MGFRDRWYTPRTAAAILSWRIAVGVGVAVAMGVAGVNWIGAVVAGAAVYGGLVLAAMPARERRAAIDPFAVGEPWRRFVQGAQRAANRLHETVSSTSDGPLRERLADIAEKLDHGLDETWSIARRGNDIDGAVRRLDPTGLKSKLETLEKQAAETGSDDVGAALESVRSQLATTERLQDQSARTADRLRLTQTRLDELVARASEVAIGAGDTDAYEHDVDDLVIELEGLRLALEETNRP